MSRPTLGYAMFEAIDSPYLAPFDGTFVRSSVSTEPPDDAEKKSARKKRLGKLNEELAELQAMMYALNQHAVLLVFQALDAAGKDGTIRAVMQGVDPAGIQLFSFKQPSAEELDHDFLWRTSKRLPERGRIGIFNRSYYEEVVVVRVHPEYLDAQNLPDRPPLDDLWQQRYEAIRNHELHLANSGTLVLKFWLNVSRREQKKRFLARIDEPEKHWKFNAGDVVEHGYYDAYMEAYEAAIRATSRPWAPWYVIPADSKTYMRVAVADIIVRNLQRLRLRYPKMRKQDLARFEEMRELLETEGPTHPAAEE